VAAERRAAVDGPVEGLTETLEDLLWYSPCPEGFEIGPWREACAEIAQLCGDKVIPLHHEDLNRLLEEATRQMQGSG